MLSKEEKTARARQDLDRLLSDWSDRHELPPLEELAIIAGAAAHVAQELADIEEEKQQS